MKTNHIRTAGLATGCIALGIGAGAIADAGARGGADHPGNAAGHTDRGYARYDGGHAGRGHPNGFGPGAGRGLARRAVQGRLVVPDGKGGFVTEAFERGTVQSVSGSMLAIAVGTPTATYRTLDVTVPANATIRNNGATTTLDKLAPGERVAVLQSPTRTLVAAHAPRTSGSSGSGQRATKKPASTTS